MAGLAGRQHGVVSRAQLLESGVGRKVIDRSVANGLLHPVHRGVYAVGHRLLSRQGVWMAAVLAGGPGAVVSHRSGTAVWQVRQDSRPVVDITVPTGRVRRAGLCFHRAQLPADEITTVDRIPVTTISRTLLDLAAVTNCRQVERAINETEVRRLWDEVSLPALVTRHPTHPGATTARMALEARAEGPTLTRQELEERFLAIVRRHRLPRPEVNALLPLGDVTYEIDFLWREQRLAVEVDGRDTHGTATAFEDDRERDRRLSIADWRPARFTWRQLDVVERDLPALLGTVGTCAR